MKVAKFHEMKNSPEYRQLMVDIVESFHHTKPVEDYLNLDSDPVMWRLLLIAYRFNEHHDALKDAYTNVSIFPNRKENVLNWVKLNREMLKQRFAYDMDQVAVWPDFINGLDYTAADETFLIGVIGSLYRKMKEDWASIERRLNM